MATKKFSIKELMQSEFKRYDLSQEWRDTIGDVEHGFNAMIWGLSGSGKTTFVLRMCEQLTEFGKVYYNSLEQGRTGSLQDNVKSSGINYKKCEGKFMFGQHTFDEMLEEIEKNGAKFIAIDSCQYMGNVGLTYNQYKKLKALCKKGKKSLIIVSHAVGVTPKGNHAKAIRYDVDIKIHVVNGKTNVDSRYGKTKTYKIFENKKTNSLF